jgi:FkbM family methyltransferase
MTLLNPDLAIDYVNVQSIQNIDEKSKLITFPDGFKCYSHSSIEETEFIYNEIMIKEEYLKHGLKLEGDICVFDIGANIGIFTLFVKAKCPQAVIHAFEPIPETFEVLKRNVEFGQHEKVKLHNLALGATNGRRTFVYYPNMAGSSTSTPVIKKVQRQMMEEGLGKIVTSHFFRSEIRFAPVSTLSTIIEEENIERIDVLKIDVEGDELAVLQGIAVQHYCRIGSMMIQTHSS